MDFNVINNIPFCVAREALKMANVRSDLLHLNYSLICWEGRIGEGSHTS